MIQIFIFFRYWIEQVGALRDTEGSKPIVVVGTHADKVSKEDLERHIAEMKKRYPTPSSWIHTASQIQGHFTISLHPGGISGLSELKSRLMDIALNHPKIGVRQVRVPKSFITLQIALRLHKQSSPYYWWRDFVTLPIPCEIVEQGDKNKMSLPQLVSLLHDVGSVVWHDTPKLQDIVVIDPQWLADAMAGVVSVMSQDVVARQGGMISWAKIQEAFKLKYVLFAIPMLFIYFYATEASNQRHLLQLLICWNFLRLSTKPVLVLLRPLQLTQSRCILCQV